ncbi:Transcription factor GATA-5 [Mortierella sp. AD031]|nr:Transcription factor GATA-5 [Mortierella sp. AD031]
MSSSRSTVPVHQVKPKEDPESGSSHAVRGLTLLSGEEAFGHGGQVEGEESSFVVISPPPEGGAEESITEDVWTHSGHVGSSSGGFGSFAPVSYQHQHLHVDQQQSTFEAVSPQQQQAQSRPAQLPGVKEISGFYPDMSLSEPLMFAHGYHSTPDQGTHAHYPNFYTTPQYSASGFRPLPLSNNSYPASYESQERPRSSSSRRERRLRNQHSHYGVQRHSDAPRQQSNVKFEDIIGRTEAYSSSAMVGGSEVVKHEQAGAASDDHGAMVVRRQHDVQDQDPDPKACNNCHTTSTPSWRRCPKGRILLCNACGLYQKLHGKARPHYMTKDGTIKIKRIAPEHPPCARCNVTTSPSWKKGPHGEAICNTCSLSMRQGRAMTKTKIVARAEYQGPGEMLAIGMVDMFSGETSGAPFSESTSTTRGSYSHGVGVGEGEGSYSGVGGVQQQRTRSSSSRHSSKTSRQGNSKEHPSRAGVNQYQGSGSRPFVFGGYGQVGSAYGMGHYNGCDTSAYNLGCFHGYPSSLAGWQPDVAAYGAGGYANGQGPFTFDSGSPAQLHTPPALQRVSVGSFRMDSSSSAFAASDQTSAEGQQLLVPFNHSQSNYIAWEQSQQSHLPQTSLQSITWSGVGGGADDGDQAMGMSPGVSFSQDQQSIRMSMSNQRTSFNYMRQQDVLNQAQSTFQSNEFARTDRFQGAQYYQLPHANNQQFQVQQPQQHFYRSGYDSHQHQHHQQYAYLSSIQTHSHSPNQDQANYEVALQTFVQSNSEDTTMPSVTPRVAIIDTSAGQVDQDDGAAVPTETDSTLLTEPSDYQDTVDAHDGVEASKLETMAAETLVHTFFDRRNASAGPSSSSGSDQGSRMTGSTVTTVKKARSGSAIADEQGKVPAQHQRRGSVGISTLSASDRSSSAASSRAVEEMSGGSSLDRRRPRRSERHRAVSSTSCSGKKQDLMSLHLDRHH